MKRDFRNLFEYSIIALCLLFVTEKSFAKINPVAELIKQKHDLKIGFKTCNLFSNAHELSGKNLRVALSKGTVAEINTKKLYSLVQQAPAEIILNIPFKGGVIAVELASVNILTPDFTVRTSENKIISYTPGKYYQGIIHGNPNSLVAFSFFKDEIYGTISDNENGNIVVGRILRPGNENEYIIYSDKNLLHSSANFCKTPDYSSEKNTLQQLAQISAQSKTIKCAKLYYETDYDLYLNNNSNSINTVNWMTAVHNNVATLFSNDQISVALSEVFVWTTADPYIGVDATEQLALFKSTRLSFNGNVGQLVAIDNNNGGLSAGVNTICTTNNYSYADIDFEFSAVPTYSWTVQFITHEFGHLLGSQHTNNCSWPGGAIDNCAPPEGGCSPGPTPVNGGTIMSNCELAIGGINFTNGFGPLPAAAIQNAINSAPCLGTLCVVCPSSGNNECSSPVSISINTNCVYTSGTFCGATQSMPAINCGGNQATNAYDVWYKFTPDQSNVIINCLSSANTNAVIAVYSGACGGLTLLNCSDATTTGGIETISTNVIAGNPYLIRIYDYNGATTGTNFGICVTQSCLNVINNECITASTLNVNPTCTFLDGELCSATQSFPPDECSGFVSTEAYDLFYAITSPQSSVRITCISGLTTDMVLSIYSGSCDELVLQNCSDTSTSGGTEVIDTILTPGIKYYVRVYDWNGNINGTDFKICAQYFPCTIPAAPVTATATFSTICSGTTTTLSATGTLSPGANWRWYSGSCGGTPLGVGSFIVVSPSSTTSYFVRAENGTCFSACKNITINVNLTPDPPATVNALPTSICSASSASLSVTGTLTPGSIWQWYSASCSGTPEGTGVSISVSPSTSSDYFVRSENGNCYSDCLNSSVSVSTTPSDPVSASGNSPICAGTISTLEVNGVLSPGAKWQWYSGSCGGVAVDSGASINVSPLSTTTYFVRAENNGCFSNCSSVIVNVTASPNSPLSGNASPSTLCSAGSSTLTVSGTLSVDATWQWYSGTCGGVPVGTGVSISVSPLTTTNYFVRAENGTCASVCSNVLINVSTTPGNPVSASGNSPVCAGSNSTLQVNGTLSPGATWRWYANSCGTNLVGTGASIIVSPSSTTTYYVRAENNGCFSNCSSIIINVNPTPSAPTNVSALPSFICSAGAASTLSLTGTLSPGATWHWYTGACGNSPAGTGVSISVTPTSTTNYFVRAENGTCSSVCVNASVNVASIPANPVSVSGTSPVCSGSNSTLQVNGALSSGASWHWYKTSCGGTPEDTGSSITISPSTTTTYFVRAENGACFSNCVNTTINVNPTPSAPLSSNASPTFLCSAGSSSLTVSGTLSVGASWHWYTASCGGTPVGTGVSISVSPLSTTNYFVRAENGSCFSTCTNSSVSVSAVPNNPDAATGTTPVCSGSNSSLLVTGTLSTGATWHWYVDSCNGISIDTGSSIIVSPTTASTYFVRAENGNCISNCVNTSVNVLTNPSDPQTINSSTTILCAGDSAILSEIGIPSAGSNWYWYEDSCSGNSIGQGTTIFVSPSTTKTYYVRAEDSNCNSNCFDITINVNPLPIKPIIVVTGDTLSVGNYPSYQWYSSINGIDFILLGNTEQQKATTQRYYFVLVTDLNGCMASSDTIFYVHTFLLSVNNSEYNLSVYPNPTNDNINIIFNSAKTTNADLKIFDHVGRLIYSGNILENKKSVVSLAQYADGIYQLLIAVDGKFFMRKVLKQ